MNPPPERGALLRVSGRAEQCSALRDSWSQGAIAQSWQLSLNYEDQRKVLDCGSPLLLWTSWSLESARGLVQSKMLTRQGMRLMAARRARFRGWNLPLSRSADHPIGSTRGMAANLPIW